MQGLWNYKEPEQLEETINIREVQITG
jgi:hypothetical protein